MRPLPVPAARVLQHRGPQPGQEVNRGAVARCCRADAFEKLDDKPIANELHIHTWPDATLREIADLVQDSNSDAQKLNKRLSICVVSETRDGRVLIRKVGYVNTSRRLCADDSKTLASVRFHPGDLLDIAMVD